MFTKKSLKIARDLTKKYPKGPDGKYKKSSYHIGWVWSSTHKRYRDTPFLNDHPNQAYVKWAGYDPKDLFEIDTNNLYGLVAEAFEGERLSSAAITRRSNVLAERLEHCKNYVKKVGIEGIYKVRWGYSLDSCMYFYGKNNIDVQAAASIFNGAFDKDITYVPELVYQGPGSHRDAINLNEKRVTTMTHSEEREAARAKRYYESTLKALEDKKERVKVFKSLIEMQEDMIDA